MSNNCSFFKAYPKARELFKNRRGDNIYSVEFQAHGHRVLGALGMIIASSDDPAVVKVILDALKTSHKEKGIKAEFYEVSNVIVRYLRIIILY